MKFELVEWGTHPVVGKGYAADVEGKWCSFLEARKGGYRGDHIHPVDQYSVLLAGEAMVVKEIEGEQVEFPLKNNKVHVTPAGMAHILIPLTDSILYEWWDGPFIAEPCPEVFDQYKEGRVGPTD